MIIEKQIQFDEFNKYRGNIRDARRYNAIETKDRGRERGPN